MPVSDNRLKSGMILEGLRKSRHSGDVVDVEEEKVKLVIFVSGTKRYAFYGSDVREIIRECEIFWVPSLPEYIPGLINLRGDIESVIDIGCFLGAEKKENSTRFIIIAVRGDFHTGILTDGIEDVVDVPVNSINSPLSTLDGVARELASGEILIDEEVVTLLDIEKLEARITI